MSLKIHHLHALKKWWNPNLGEKNKMRFKLWRNNEKNGEELIRVYWDMRKNKEHQHFRKHKRTRQANFYSWDGNVALYGMQNLNWQEQLIDCLQNHPSIEKTIRKFDLGDVDLIYEYDYEQDYGLGTQRYTIYHVGATLRYQRASHRFL